MEQLSRLAQWLGVDASPNEVLPVEALPNPEDQEGVQRVLQEFAVLLEYERLQDLAPAGVYVTPSFDSALLWHGTIFVRQGLYRGGIFKFVLQFPPSYPEAPPGLSFTTPVFHPLVDLSTGKVDLSLLYPDWHPGRDLAAFAVPHVHRMLLRRECFISTSRPPLNPEAQDLFLQQPAAFAERAAACAAASLSEVYSNSPGCSLQFTKGPPEAHERILEALRAGDASASPEDKKAAFVDWFCTHYANRRVQAGQVETILLSNTKEDLEPEEQMGPVSPETAVSRPVEARKGLQPESPSEVSPEYF